jgi:hypothetical protein
VRTTVNLDAELLRQAKSRARQRQMTLGGYLEDAIRRDLVRLSAEPAPVTLPAFPAGQVRRGIDLLSNRSMFEAMEEDGSET